MHTTPVSLLDRLRLPDSQEPWRRFVDLYTPLLQYWARRFPLQPADQLDLVQEVLTALCTELPRFERRPGKRFRGWLWMIMLNKYRERQRRLRARPVTTASSALVELEEPCIQDEIEETEYRQYLVNRIMQLMQAEFEPTTWKACWAFVVQARSAKEVAEELGITTNAIYLAKARVLRRLREDLAGLLDD